MSSVQSLGIKVRMGVPDASERKRYEPSYIVKQRVTSILKRVQEQGDRALVDYTRWFDRIELTPADLLVPISEIEIAYSKVSEKQIAALKQIASRLRTVSEKTLERISFSIDVEGTTVSTSYRPISEVGCYVPGGIAAYPSSLLMCAVPAQVAGVERIVVCTPPKEDGIHPLTLVAADICGVDEVYQIGGAQAIAALSYGTETISPVQKIVGPGNAYVALAKSEVSNHTLIDSPAGPSELLVIADESAPAKLVALDLISQAEHSSDAISILVSPSENLCIDVLRELDEIHLVSQRRDIIVESLKQNGGIYCCDSLQECIRYANEFSAEHVQVMTRDARDVAKRITSAGLVLLGNYTPVAASDYGLGVNHVLPTQGYASVHSGLSVLDFVRIINVAESTRMALEGIADTVCTIAEAEGLPNHARAITGRFEE